MRRHLQRHAGIAREAVPEAVATFCEAVSDWPEVQPFVGREQTRRELAPLLQRWTEAVVVAPDAELDDVTIEVGEMMARTGLAGATMMCMSSVLTAALGAALSARRGWPREANILLARRWAYAVDAAFSASYETLRQRMAEAAQLNGMLQGAIAGLPIETGERDQLVQVSTQVDILLRTGAPRPDPQGGDASS